MADIKPTHIIYLNRAHVFNEGVSWTTVAGLHPHAYVPKEAYDAAIAALPPAPTCPHGSTGDDCCGGYCNMAGADDPADPRDAPAPDAVEALVKAAEAVAEDACSYICPSTGKAGEPITHDPRCVALRAAIASFDAKGGRNA